MMSSTEGKNELLDLENVLLSEALDYFPIATELKAT